jgi:hypothetical protein
MQAPLQYVQPVGQMKVQALARQTGWPPVTMVVHAFPHVFQLLALLVVSMQAPLQVVGVVEGQVDVHA